jgi:galactokinase
MFKTINSIFQAHFSAQPINVIAPGRINLIGEHTDYNNGFVLPAAVDKSMYFAMGKSGDLTCSFHASDIGESLEIDLSQSIEKSEKGWANYLLGILAELQKRGIDVQGVNCVFNSDIPIGAGMSSSAALESGFIFGLNELFNLGLDRMEMAKIGQRAEIDFVGLDCGIMDQFASLHGKANHFIKLDCQTMEYQYFPYNRDDIAIILCDTKVSHNLAASEYNVRHQQCKEVVTFYQQFYPEIKTLRDISFDNFKLHEKKLDPTLRNRANHVLEDNLRVYAVGEMLFINNLEVAGGLLNKAHESLREDYEVSCEELDFLVKTASKVKSVLGSRMMGGGFGGCTINLVKKSHLNDFETFMKVAYQKEYDIDLPIYTVSLTDGVRLFP